MTDTDKSLDFAMGNPDSENIQNQQDAANNAKKNSNDVEDFENNSSSEAKESERILHNIDIFVIEAPTLTSEDGSERQPQKILPPDELFSRSEVIEDGGHLSDIKLEEPAENEAVDLNESQEQALQYTFEDLEPMQIGRAHV